MTYLRLDAAGLARANALHTAREIEQQPASWERTLALMSRRRTEVQGFLAPLLARPELQIILTGAGSSAFIGECLAPTLSVELGRRVRGPGSNEVTGSGFLAVYGRQRSQR